MTMMMRKRIVMSHDRFAMLRAAAIHVRIVTWNPRCGSLKTGAEPPPRVHIDYDETLLLSSSTRYRTVIGRLVLLRIRDLFFGWLDGGIRFIPAVRAST